MIITLTGTNTFMLKTELNKAVAEFVNKHGDIALEKYDGDEASAERMMEAVQSLPFLASKKLVVLHNPSTQKPFVKAIEQVLKNVSATTELIMVEPNLDKRSAYYKVLRTKTEYKEFNVLEMHNLSTWIVQYVKEQDGNISLIDAKYVIERVGQNQQMLANELDKLITYSPQITRQTINLLTELTPQSTIFELLDAAFAQESKKIIRLYKEQRALKVEPQQIVAMLAWQLHVLAVVKAAGERGAEQIAKEAKLNPFVVRKTMGIARKVSLNHVKALVRRALELDVKLKTKTMDADDALVYFLLTIGK